MAGDRVFGAARCPESQAGNIASCSAVQGLAPLGVYGSEPAGQIWGLSSAGRAPDLHSGGQEFDPPRLHQRFSIESLSTSECLAVQSDDIALFLRKLRLTSYREISKSTLLVTASKRITSDWCPSGRALGKIVSSISSKVCQPEKDSVVQVKYTNQAQDRTVLS